LNVPITPYDVLQKVATLYRKQFISYGVCFALRWCLANKGNLFGFGVYELKHVTPQNG